MTLIDWLLVFLLNGSVIAYALWQGRDTDSSDEWFLAGRSLPWWMIGLSAQGEQQPPLHILAGPFHIAQRYVPAIDILAIGTIGPNALPGPKHDKDCGQHTNNDGTSVTQNSS